MHHSFTRHTGVLAALLLAGCPADPSTTTEGSTTTVAATDTATGATMTGATMTGTTIDPGPTTGAAARCAGHRLRRNWRGHQQLGDGREHDDQ